MTTYRRPEPNPYCVLLGQRIVELRTEMTHTQAQFADSLGIPREKVSKWERGVNYPKIEHLPLIANQLNTTVDELLKPIAEVVLERTQ